MLRRPFPRLRSLEGLPLAQDQPAVRFVEAPTQLMPHVAVESHCDPLAERVVPSPELPVLLRLDSNLEDEANSHQMPPSTLIVIPETNRDRSLARKSATPATSSDVPSR